MKQLHLYFLEALGASIRGSRVQWQGLLGQEELHRLFRLARQHHVWGLVADAVFNSPDGKALDAQTRSGIRRELLDLTAAHALRTARFLALYEAMEADGLSPLVLKGLVCRSLYPNPAARPSSDEDLLVPADQFDLAASWLLDHGMVPSDPESAAESFERGFLGQGLYLELHRTPFSPDSPALQACNEDLAAVHETAVRLTAEGGTVRTMDPAGHMLYLLLHAYKHFIHSGFGVRQVCDMILWAEHYGAQINWETLFACCRRHRCERFAEVVFQTGYRYLGFDAVRAGYPPERLEKPLPLEAFVEDMVDAGVFGSSDRNRQHSSTVTVNAVEAQRSGARASLLQSVFPARKQLEGAYPWLRRKPLLLPAAWCIRLVRYGKEILTSDQTAVESLRIGAQRKDLLQKLDILD